MITCALIAWVLAAPTTQLYDARLMMLRNGDAHPEALSAVQSEIRRRDLGEHIDLKRVEDCKR